MTLRRRIAAALAALVAVFVAAAPAAAQDEPEVGAPAAIVIDAKSGERLYAKNADDERAIASTTKLMTALLTLERAEPADVFTMPPYASSPVESKLGLQTGERMTVRDLLRATLLPSANDAAYDLAVNIGGSEDEFVDLMNERASSLGLDDTQYSTPVGLDDPGNYSSARDLADLTRRLLRNRTFARVVDMESAELQSGSMPRTIVNRNTLVLEYPWVTGVKTGHTLQAGYVLVGSATARGASVVSVVLGTASEAARDADSLELLEWALAQFRRVTAVEGDREYATAAVRWRDGDEVALLAEEDVRLTTREGERVRRRVNAPMELEGPLATGTPVGELEVVYRDRVVRTVPLVTASPVRGAGLVRKAVASVGGLGAAVALLALVGAIALLALRIRTGWGSRERERARR
jgi:D-alanyl-D-alanine carboxypeptidase (penicillin-binding protein 5/6)